uniref:hypothetical protein n=1 Tax=Pseudomonas asturiensis TaxID=1190415 RepID=UPI000408B21B|nr:hypothetical protein [Pseudomonas asturiensis]
MDKSLVMKFGDICREVKITTRNPIADGYERYIGLEHLDSESLKIRRWGVISEDNPGFSRVFKKGNILFGKRRPYLKKAAIAEFDGICSGDIIVMEPCGSYMPHGLIPFIAQSNKFWEWAIKTSSGSLSPRTKFKSLAEFEIPTGDQSNYDSRLAVLQACQALLEKKHDMELCFRRYVKVVIERRLSEMDGDDFSFQELLDSGDIIDIQDGNHGADHPKASEYVETGVPFVMASDLNSGSVDLNRCKKLPKLRTDSLRIGFSEPGDILLSHKGTVGLVAVTPEVDGYVMLTPQVTYYRVAAKGRLRARYLEIIFRTEGFQKMLTSLAAQSTRDYVGITAQKKIRIFVATEEQQDELVCLWDQLQSFGCGLAENRKITKKLYESFMNG